MMVHHSSSSSEEHRSSSFIITRDLHQGCDMLVQHGGTHSCGAQAHHPESLMGKEFQGDIVFIANNGAVMKPACASSRK